MSEPKLKRWIPWRSGIAIVGTLLYFVMPFDLIPDALWLVGILDDTALAALALRWVLKDFRSYRARGRNAPLDVGAPETAKAPEENE
jgi:uncharacterized membrane protein YkvA (DUF1232 family)